MFKLRRIIAFLLDLSLIYILTSCLTSLNYMNPYLENMENASTAYKEVLDDYRSLASEDDIEEFIANMQDKTYNLEKSRRYVYIWYLLFYLAYFVVFAYFTEGQTLGKKLMHLKIVNEDESRVSIFGLLKRTITNGSSLFMGMNISALASLILTFLMPANQTYFYLFMTIFTLSIVIEIANIIIYIKNSDKKCLNDFISGTKVISV